MSVRLTSADFDDSLITTLPSDLTLSGDFSFGYWIKPITTVGGVMAVSIAPTTGSFGFIVMGEFPHKAYYNGSAISGSSFTLTADTWYWVTVVRSGAGSNNVTYAVYDDTTSTTPAFTPLTTTDTTSFTGVDVVVIGDETAYWNNGCVNAEFELLKIHTGVAWSAAESRTESQNYSIQKSGGTDRYAWKLKDIDADTDGLYEIGGSGPNFTNSGVIAGASTPVQLTPTGTTLYFLDSAASGSNFGQLQVGGSAPSTATTATGWTVDTVAASNYALMAYASERASTVFSGTAQPAGNPDNSLGDCFRSTSTMTGDFATGVWTIAIPVIAVSAAAGQDGRVRVRLWKSANATGTSPTEITSGAVAGTTVTNLATGAEQVSTVTTGSITGFSMANEYLFVQVAWEITGAAT